MSRYMLNREFNLGSRVFSLEQGQVQFSNTQWVECADPNGVLESFVSAGILIKSQSLPVLVEEAPIPSSPMLTEDMPVPTSQEIVEEKKKTVKRRRKSQS